MPTSPTQDIYIADTEVEILPTSEMYEGEGRMFCFVLCFCWASSKQDSIERIKASLKQDDMKLIRVESVTTYGEANWSTEDQQEIDGWANLAYESEEVVYSHFSCYYK